MSSEADFGVQNRETRSRPFRTPDSVLFILHATLLYTLDPAFNCPVAELSDALDFGSSFIAGENPAGAANFDTQCASLRSRASKAQRGWGSTNTACHFSGTIAQAVEQRIRIAKIGARLPVAPPICRPVCEQQNRRSVKPLPSGLHWCKSNPADQTPFIAE